MPLHAKIISSIGKRTGARNRPQSKTGGGSALGSATRLFELLLGRPQTGNPLQLALSQLGLGTDPLDDLDLSGIDLFGGGGGGGGGTRGGGGAGGGGVGDLFGGSREAADLAQRFALEQLTKEQTFATSESAKEQAFAAAEADKARQFERAQELERLKAERERIFTDMLGTDPVRAVLFALGIGGEILPGGDRFADLAPLPGARAQADATQQALSRLTSRDVQVGQEGVTGLGPAVKTAAAFGGQAGGTGGNIADQRKLLLSGFGVGAKRGKGRPGQSREETLRQIASVTPQGIL